MHTSDRMEPERDSKDRLEETVQLSAKDRRDFVPGDDWILLSQGAEARIWKVPHLEIQQKDGGLVTTTAICKERFAKKYRHPTLDARLTKLRCRMEARLLEKCNAKSIPVPNVLRVDSSWTNSTALIFLEHIDGKTVRDFLEDDLLPRLEPNGNDSVLDVSNDDDDHVMLHELAMEIGITVAHLHSCGMVHGDLTTSNMMLTASVRNTKTVPRRLKSKLVLLDFGLAKNATAAEERAVDLYVLERALQSTHPTLPESFLETLLTAYADPNGSSTPPSTTKASKNDTLTRLEKVRQRGRKRECFG